MPSNLPHHEGLAEMADRDSQQISVVKWGFVKRVLNTHLIVQIDQFQHTGRILVPDSSKRKPTTGHVVAVASDIKDIEVGEKILFSQFAGYLLKFEDMPLARMIGYSEVIAVLHENAPDLNLEGA
jgi:co-chaperonin GroES (HSP10)